MDTISDNLLHSLAQNYLACLADFPADLQPEHLDVPDGEQVAVFTGLIAFRLVIGNIYTYFARLAASGDRWLDREICYRAIEAPVKLLWALGAAGQLVQSPDGLDLLASRADLDRVTRLRSLKDPAAAFAVLEAVGFRIDYRSADGLSCPGGFKKCAAAAVRYPDQNEALLRALAYYAAHMPVVKNGTPFEIFLRADFRPLLPGYAVYLPHLPADEGEVIRTFDPVTREMWLEITRWAASRFPQYRAFYRVPRLRNRGWLADYSAKGKDYGLWTFIGEDGGLRVRMVLKPKGYRYSLEHIDELSPRFQELYLNCCACRDCIHCGKHIFFAHGDHLHRLCKGPWFYSPYLHPEDLPDVERLIDIHIANLK